MPFPRDWLGPREELIPFGPSPGGADEPAPPPLAEAFWGEESVALHAVLPAPAPSAGAAPNAGSRYRITANRVVVGALIALVVAAAAVGKLAGSPTAGGGPVSGSNIAAAGFMDLALLRGAIAPPQLAVARQAAHKPVRPRPRAVEHRTAAQAQRAVAIVSPAPTRTQTAAARAVSTTAPVSSATGSGRSSDSSAAAPAPVHSTAISHAAGVRAGPVGAGAPFGPGQLK